MINHKEIDPMYQLDTYLKTEAGDITFFSSLSLIAHIPCSCYCQKLE